MQSYQGSAFTSSDTTSSINYLNEIDQNVIGKYYLKKFNQLNNPRARQNDNTKQKDNQKQGQLVVQQKCVQYVIEPIFKLIEPINKFYIYGDFPVEADFFSKETNDLQTILEESKQWCQWKQCVQVKYNRNSGFLELFQKSNNSGLSEYQYIVNILQSLQDQRMYDLSQVIQSYGVAILNNLGQIKQLFQFVNNNPQLLEYLENRFYEFQQKGLKWIEENIDSSQCYTYVFGKIDFKGQCYYNCQEGFSEGLLQLLGLDLESAARIILKVGKLEFIDQYGRFIKLYKKLVFAISRKRGQQEELHFNIITVDGFKVPVKVLVINPPIQMSEISEDPLIDKYYKEQFQQVRVQTEKEKKICGFTVLK